MAIDWASMHDQLYSGKELNTTALNLTEHLAFYDGMFVHPHWYQFLDDYRNMSSIYFWMVGIYVMFACGLGALGNFLVIYIFTTTRGLRTAPNMLLVNLAISDFGFSVVNGFPLMTISSFMRKWTFGSLPCSLYGALGGVFGYTSIMTLVFVSADRYFVISNPFEAMRKCTKGRAMMQIVFIWIWASLLSALPLFGFGQYILEGLLIECGFDFFTQTLSNKIYNHISFYVGFVFPVCIIIMCYVMIVRAVAAQSAMMRGAAEKMKGEAAKEDRERKQEIQLAKIAAGTITLFILSWISYAVVCQVAIWGNQQYVTPLVSQLPALAAKTSAMWNPILYCLSHPKFRAVLEEKFPFLLCCKGSNIDKGEDEKSEATKVTKGHGLKRTDSEDSEGGSEMSVSGVENHSHAQVYSQPGGHRQHRNAAPQSSYAPSAGGPYHAGDNDVNPKAMTRAANTIFSHLVTAYEGMRVLTTSGDGAGADRVMTQGFDNPGFVPYYYPPPAQPGLPGAPQVYSIPVPGQPMMMMAAPGAGVHPGAAAAVPPQPNGPAPQLTTVQQTVNQPQLIVGNQLPQQENRTNPLPPVPNTDSTQTTHNAIITTETGNRHSGNKDISVGNTSVLSLSDDISLPNDDSKAASKIESNDTTVPDDIRRTPDEKDLSSDNTKSSKTTVDNENTTLDPLSSNIEQTTLGESFKDSDGFDLPPPPEELLDETEENQSEGSYDFRADPDPNEGITNDMNDADKKQIDEVTPQQNINTDDMSNFSIADRIKALNNASKTPIASSFGNIHSKTVSPYIQSVYKTKSITSQDKTAIANNITISDQTQNQALTEQNAQDKNNSLQADDEQHSSVAINNKIELETIPENGSDLESNNPLNSYPEQHENDPAQVVITNETAAVVTHKTGAVVTNQTSAVVTNETTVAVTNETTAVTEETIARDSHQKNNVLEAQNISKHEIDPIQPNGIVKTELLLTDSSDINKTMPKQYSIDYEEGFC